MSANCGSVERLVIMSSSHEIGPGDLEMFTSGKRNEVEGMILSSTSFQDFKDKTEAAFIRHQLELHRWNVSKTAESLEMERSNLYTKIKKYGLEREGATEE